MRILGIIASFLVAAGYLGWLFYVNEVRPYRGVQAYSHRRRRWRRA